MAGINNTTTIFMNTFGLNDDNSQSLTVEHIIIIILSICVVVLGIIIVYIVHTAKSKKEHEASLREVELKHIQSTSVNNKAINSIVGGHNHDSTAISESPNGRHDAIHYNGAPNSSMRQATHDNDNGDGSVCDVEDLYVKQEDMEGVEITTREKITDEGNVPVVDPTQKATIAMDQVDTSQGEH